MKHSDITNQQSSRFFGSQREFEILEEDDKKIAEEFADFKPKEEKPLEKYYGGANELMQFFSKYEQQNAPKKDYWAIMRDLPIKTLPHSLEETGQKEIDENYDAEQMQSADSQARHMNPKR